jgi:uncharacterized protein (TIGR02186 family)
MNRFLLIIALLLAAPAAAAPPLIADLSNYQITMDSSFNGTRIFVFGTRNDSGDVLVVVRGPNKDYVVRKKKEIGGIWVNAERVKLFRIPDFYAIASSKPLSELAHTQAFKQLAIGHDNLFKTPYTGKEYTFYKEFTDAYVAYQQKRHLYKIEPAKLTFMGETLFKTVIDFPDNIPPGMYNAEIYLLSDNTIVGTHILPIRVQKVGIDAFLYNYAHQNPFLYGITAVVLALSAGWFAGRLFEKI